MNNNSANRVANANANANANGVANAGAGKNTSNKKAVRRTRKQIIENGLHKLLAIKESGKKYKGKKTLNETIKNYRNALVAEEEKIAIKSKEAEERARLKAKKAENKAAAKAARKAERSTAKNKAPKVKVPTKEEMKSLTKNELIARFASIVNVVKETAVNNTAVKAAKAEAKAIMRVAKAEYEACKEVCKARYETEHARAKAIVEGANAE